MILEIYLTYLILISLVLKLVLVAIASCFSFFGVNMILDIMNVAKGFTQSYRCGHLATIFKDITECVHFGPQSMLCQIGLNI